MSKMGFTQAQVEELQRLLREIYKTAQEAGQPFNYQVVYVWSKMDLDNPELLAGILMLLREQMRPINSMGLGIGHGTLQLLQWLSESVMKFYETAHRMIDELALKEDQLS